MADSLVLANVLIEVGGAKLSLQELVNRLGVTEKAVATHGLSMTKSFSRLALGIGGTTAAIMVMHRAIVSAFRGAIEEDRKLAAVGLGSGLSKNIDEAASAWDRFSAALGRFVLDSAPVKTALSLLAEELENYARAFDKMMGVADKRSMRSVGSRAGAISTGVAGQRAKGFASASEAFFGIPNRDQSFAEIDRILADSIPAFTEINDVTIGWTNNLADARAELERIVNQFPELTTSAESASGSVEQASEMVKSMSMNMELVAVAASTAVEGMSGVLLGTQKINREFFADMLASMVPVLLGYAAIGVVRGILGDPSGYAAAIYAANAAVIAATASRALGGPSSASRDASSSVGRGGGGGGAGMAGRARAGASIIINVEGSLIGTNPDSLARDLNRLITNNQRDGAR